MTDYHKKQLEQFEDSRGLTIKIHALGKESKFLSLNQHSAKTLVEFIVKKYDLKNPLPDAPKVEVPERVEKDFDDLTDIEKRLIISIRKSKDVKIKEEVYGVASDLDNMPPAIRKKVVIDMLIN